MNADPKSEIRNRKGRDPAGEICFLTHYLDRMPCGVGRYVESVLEELRALDIGNRIRLVHDQPNAHPLYRQFPETIIPMPKGPYRETRWCQWHLPRALRRLPPALVYCPIQTNPPAFHTGAPLVLTIWDFAPLLWADPVWPWRRRFLIYGLILRRALRRAAAILVPSESTRADLLRLYGRQVERGGAHRVEVVPCAADARFRPRRDLPRPVAGRYLFYVGTLDARKNVATLIRAVAALKPGRSDFGLVLVTPRQEFRASGLEALARDLGVIARLDVREKMSMDDLVALYTHCEAFVFPSLYEGFGLPVLEAMSCGAPVITTRGSSLPEVAGEAAAFFRENDPEALAVTIEQVAGDPALRRRLCEAGVAQAARFSWRKTAEHLAAVFERVIAAKTAS